MFFFRNSNYKQHKEFKENRCAMIFIFGGPDIFRGQNTKILRNYIIHIMISLPKLPEYKNKE